MESKGVQVERTRRRSMLGGLATMMAAGAMTSAANAAGLGDPPKMRAPKGAVRLAAGSAVYVKHRGSTTKDRSHNRRSRQRRAKIRRNTKRTRQQ